MSSRPDLVWRLLVPVTFAAAGTLFVTSHLGADGTDLRSSRDDDLADVVARQSARVDAANDRLASLQRQIDRMAADVDSAEVTARNRRLDRLRQDAGLTPVSGPGLTVVLDDAPDAVADNLDPDGPVGRNDLVVHQQDIQAVANALWQGGAVAMTIRGQRVVATTGIKCVGNVVILHGRPYSPPYDIAAVGDPTALRSAVQDSEYVGFYREVVDRYDLGFAMRTEPALDLPGYTGTTELASADALGG